MTKELPKNIEAEELLLGHILIDGNLMTTIIDKINVDDFYSIKNGIIFSIYEELFNKNIHIDIVSTVNLLKDKKKLDKIGGRTYLTSLMRGYVSNHRIDDLVNIIKHKSILRRLVNAGLFIEDLGYKEDEKIDALLEAAEKELFSISQKNVKDTINTANSLMQKALVNIHDGIIKQGLKTGFYELDRITNGLQKKDLIILAARPSVGKTSFALDVSRHACLSGKIVAFFSLEMSATQLANRMIVAESGISSYQIKNSVSAKDEMVLSETIGRLSEMKLFIDDMPSATIQAIKSKARKLLLENKKLDLIVIDYIQLIRPVGKYRDSRVRELSEITRDLKEMAKELDVPVLALSQLSREVEHRKPAIPRLSDLRDSGSIEQEADLVLFLYRKACDRNYMRVNMTEEELQNAKLLIAKHRNGAIDNFNLRFVEDQSTFKNYD